MLILKTDQQNAWTEEDTERPGLLWGADYIFFTVKEFNYSCRKFVGVCGFDRIDKKGFEDLKIYQN